MAGSSAKPLPSPPSPPPILGGREAFLARHGFGIRLKTTGPSQAATSRLAWGFGGGLSDDDDEDDGVGSKAANLRLFASKCVRPPAAVAS